MPSPFFMSGFLPQITCRDALEEALAQRTDGNCEQHGADDIEHANDLQF